MDSSRSHSRTAAKSCGFSVRKGVWHMSVTAHGCLPPSSQGCSRHGTKAPKAVTQDLRAHTLVHYTNGSIGYRTQSAGWASGPAAKTPRSQPHRSAESMGSAPVLCPPGCLQTSTLGDRKGSDVGPATAWESRIESQAPSSALVQIQLFGGQIKMFSLISNKIK